MDPLTPLEIANDALSARILPRGAALTGVRFAGGPNLVLGFADPADHHAVPVYSGVLAGPVANRIRGGRVGIDGQLFQMPRNERGRNTLHSGPEGLHAADWTVREHREAHLTLETLQSDGAQGLPGNRAISVHYALSGQTLRIDVQARTDRTTPMNIAAHPYWNLDQQGDVGAHRLQVLAQEYLPVDQEMLPTGAVQPVEGTAFDFRTPCPVPLLAELDVCFCLTRQAVGPLRPAATLTGSNGCRLEIETTAPGLQVYSGHFLPPMSGALEAGRNLAPHAGIALEPQMWPDAPHHPAFPDILLHPGQIWRQTSLYHLSLPA